ncbi:MAG: Hpt domain-containing protein [Alphaproteobacteria bacterium]|nr:Hpt domain-containing protein [Alphaproteobacteria bacterium]MDD9920595.1 Hpt domain-containing protein [Alphaproteobacteria bacterium]
MDFSRLEILAQDDKDLVTTLVGIFMEQGPEFITEIERLLGEKDGEALKKEAHSLKGVCLNLGLDDLAAICKEVEGYALAEDFSSVKTGITQLKNDMPVVLEALKKFL